MPKPMRAAPGFGIGAAGMRSAGGQNALQIVYYRSRGEKQRIGTEKRKWFPGLQKNSAKRLRSLLM